MNLQDDDTLDTKYPEDHMSVLNEVQTSKEYLIKLTTLSCKMYDEIKKDDTENTGILD